VGGFYGLLSDLGIRNVECKFANLEEDPLKLGGVNLVTREEEIFMLRVRSGLRQLLVHDISKGVVANLNYNRLWLA